MNKIKTAASCIAFIMAVSVTGCTNITNIINLTGKNTDPADASSAETISPERMAELQAGAEYRAQSIFEKLEDDHSDDGKREEGIYEMYRLLDNPAFVTNYDEFFDTLIYADEEIVLEGDTITYRNDIAYKFSKAPDGSYSVHADWSWNDPEVVAARYVGYCQKEDAANIMMCMLPIENVADPLVILTRLRETGDIAKMKQIQVNKPDGSYQLSDSRTAVSFEMSNGNFYDVYLSNTENGWRCELP